MSDKNKGILKIYNVERIDGKPIKDGCIVLEFDDPNAREGIEDFAAKVYREGYKEFAADLWAKLKRYEK